MASAPAYAVFDFDGTLVDSARGILAGMAKTLSDNGITPRVPLENQLIGPPLLQTLAHVSGQEDAECLARLATDFKHCYDSEGYRHTDPYPGIDAALRALHATGVRLLLATNKREVPTRLILEHLGWTPLFEAIYCLDQSPEWDSKGTMLGDLLQERRLAPERTLYIGDTQGDATAAGNNNMPFLWVTWGYGTPAAGQAACGDAGDLPSLIRQLLGHSPCPEN